MTKIGPILHILLFRNQSLTLKYFICFISLFAYHFCLFFIIFDNFGYFRFFLAYFTIGRRGQPTGRCERVIGRCGQPMGGSGYYFGGYSTIFGIFCEFWWLFYDILGILRILVGILFLRYFGSPTLRRGRYVGHSSI